MSIWEYQGWRLRVCCQGGPAAAPVWREAHAVACAGVLADEAGLGKTVQAAALLALLAESKGCPGPHLVLVPRAVLSGWVGAPADSIIYVLCKFIDLSHLLLKTTLVILSYTSGAK